MCRFYLSPSSTVLPHKSDGMLLSVPSLLDEFLSPELLSPKIIYEMKASET